MAAILIIVIIDDNHAGSDLPLYGTYIVSIPYRFKSLTDAANLLADTVSMMWTGAPGCNTQNSGVLLSVVKYFIKFH